MKRFSHCGFVFMLVIAGLGWTAPATAQVGYPPDASPYRDLEYRQELSAYTGWYAAAKDPAGVAPRGGPLLGARYEVRVGGPASFTARLARVFSERRTLDPTRPAATRDLGTRSQPLYLGDVGLTLNLTGQKSVRRLVPLLNMGVGLVSNLEKRDVGGFGMGTSFTFTFGGGLRWVPGGKLQLRADIADYLYQIQYPSSYYTRASDSTQVLKDSQSPRVWKHNAALTVGASYLFFR